MKHADALHELHTTLLEHDLHNWTGRINNKLTRVLGRCIYSPQRVELSGYFVAYNQELTVRDVILHETSHAIAGPVGHSEAWKKVARELGARPSACADPETLAPYGPWRGTCPHCGYQTCRGRRPKRKLLHVPCNATLVWHWMPLKEVS